MRSANVRVGNGGCLRRSLDGLGLESVLQDGGDGFERAGIERQCPGAGRIQPLGARATLQPEDADTGADALFGLVTLSCRPKCSFKPPYARRPRGFFLPMLNGDDVGYRSH